MKQLETPRSRRRASRSWCCSWTLACVLCAGGCAAPGPGSGRADRPTVAKSAAEAAAFEPSGGSSMLRFFDELETRGLASHDDALEGALLVATGRGEATYPRRLETARRLGLVEPAFDRPAREACTIGEVSVLVARLLRTPEPVTPELATRSLIERGVLPEVVRPYQGLTGAQLVSMLGYASDAMGKTGADAFRGVTASDGAGRPTSGGEGSGEPLPVLPGPGQSGGVGSGVGGGAGPEAERSPG